MSITENLEQTEEGNYECFGSFTNNEVCRGCDKKNVCIDEFVLGFDDVELEKFILGFKSKK